MATEAATAATPRARKAHRVGPVETELGQQVQRCLRCDVLLNVLQPGFHEELKTGKRIYVKEQMCSGVLGGDGES